MPIGSSYTTADPLQVSKQLVVACYGITHGLPAEEVTNLSRYIRTAALTFHINLAQGLAEKGKKSRKRHRKEAQKAMVVLDAALGVLAELKMGSEEQLAEVLHLSATGFQLLKRLKKKNCRR